MSKLILLRHGETNKNIHDFLHAYFDEESLNTQGEKQIRKTAEKLKEFSPLALFSSSEKRAVQTVQIIASELNLPYEIIDGLEERNWGDFSGKAWSEVEAILNQLTLEERYQYLPPNGESWQTFEMRLIKALNLALQKGQGKNTLIVSHGGAIRALMPYLLNMPRNESFHHYFKNASLTIFNYDDQKFELLTLNDISYLS